MNVLILDYRSMKSVTLKKAQQGFTLIELLVVIGILAILLAIVLIAINPAKQFGNANDTKRASDVNAILNAIDQYAADNKGLLPGTLSAATCPSDTPCEITTGGGGGDICAALVTKYIAQLPQDPNNNNGKGLDCGTGGADADSYDTKYQVSVGTGDNRVTVKTTTTYSGTPITVTR